LATETSLEFRSSIPDVPIPDVSLTDFVLAKAEALRDKTAIIDGPSGRSLTYGQLRASIRRAAYGLARRGFGLDDVLAIWSPNVPEYPVAFHAAASAGGVVTTANPLATVDELRGQLQDSGAKMLVTIAPLLEKAGEAAAGSPVTEIFVLGDASGATPFAELLAEDGEPPRVTFNPAAKVVALPYSSGTTGLPKGVMLTHRNLVANLCQIRAFGAQDEQNVHVAILPFYHIYGLTLMLNSVLDEGATVVTLPRFELEGFLDTLQRYKVTFACLVPPIILGLAKHPLVDKFDLSSLHTIISGAAPMGADLEKACAARLGCSVRQGYGMTELSPVSHSTPPGKERAGSSGILAANTEARIIDTESGQALGAGRSGELLVRGPQVMLGYLNQPEATALTIDREGWLHTGDVAYVDEDGYLFIVDRVKELIKHNAFQVPPAELEALLLTHPAVADAAVVGIPDAQSGEIPKAFVVKRAEVSDQELMDFVEQRVAAYKKIRIVEFVDSIPRGSSGKILRRILAGR